MSTSITEYHIHIDGESMTPSQLFRFAKGLVIAAQPLSPQNDPDLYHQFILAHRRIRKLQRALRKAAGREKRLIRELSKSPFQKIWNGQLPIGIGEGLDDRGLYFHFADHAQCKCVGENVNV